MIVQFCKVTAEPRRRRRQRQPVAVHPHGRHRARSSVFRNGQRDRRHLVAARTRQPARRYGRRRAAPIALAPGRRLGRAGRRTGTAGSRLTLTEPIGAGHRARRSDRPGSTPDGRRTGAMSSSSITPSTPPSTHRHRARQARHGRDAQGRRHHGRRHRRAGQDRRGRRRGRRHGARARAGRHPRPGRRVADERPRHDRRASSPPSRSR